MMENGTVCTCTVVAGLRCLVISNEELVIQKTKDCNYAGL